MQQHITKEGKIGNCVYVSTWDGVQYVVLQTVHKTTYDYVALNI